MSNNIKTGTPVQVSSYVEKLYFNTELTNEQITEIFSNARPYMLKEEGDGQDLYRAFLFAFNREDGTTVSSMMQIMEDTAQNKLMGMVMLIEDDYVPIIYFGDETFLNDMMGSPVPFMGFNPDFNSVLEANATNIVDGTEFEEEGTYDAEGFYNAISSLMSTTPFSTSDEPTEEPDIITDLTGAKLKFLDVVNLENGTWQINFKSNNQNFTTFKVYDPSAQVETGYLTFSSEEPFSLTVNDKAYYDGSLQYSVDAEIWTEVSKNSAIQSVDNKIYLRGNNNTMCRTSSSPFGIFTLTGSNIKCEGNIETLLDYQTVMNGEHPVMAVSCYSYMFAGCTNLTQAPELPATTLTESCYSYMFQGCTNLTQAPELPATTLVKNCYYGMFSDCASLTQIPALPATTMAQGCYGTMFAYCTNLTQIPALPATTLASVCYMQMFLGCSSIKLSTTKTGEYVHEYRIPFGTATGTEGGGTAPLLEMFKNTGGTFTDTPELNTTYYTSNEIVQ